MKSFVLIFIMLGLVAHASEGALKVRSYNRVFQTQKISLLDLVDQNEISLKTKKKLSQIFLGDAPKIGEQRIYSGRVIATAIRKNLGKKNWILKIPHQVIVENRGYQIDHETVENELLARWASLCQDCQIRIKSLQLPALPAWVSESRWEIENDNRLPRGAFSQKLIITPAEGRNQIFWINGNAEIRKKVPVLTRSTPMGTRLTEDDFQFEWRDVTYATDTAPQGVEIIGHQAKFTMNANDILWRGSLVREKAVQRGEIVSVLIGDENWKISMQARTEQDGFVGDTINLRNLQTNRVITGRIVGQGEVEIR